MTMPDSYGLLAELADSTPEFTTRDDIGERAGLISRMLRFFQGNPVRYFTVPSASNVTPVVLPDDPRARSATCTVLGAPIIYRTDGTTPTPGGDQSVPVGGIITLTGFDSIKGFVFAAQGAVAAMLTVNYYD